MKDRKSFLPVNERDVAERNWSEVDFVYVSGDAYVDHPSFGVSIISRVLDEGNRQDKKLFFMRYWMGMSIEQIRDQTGFGESRIKMSLFRTRKRIAAQLGKEGITV